MSQRTALVLIAALTLTGRLVHAAGAELEEVVVTATKRSESLQRVPLSVTAMTSAALEQKSAENFADYARSVPSLSFIDLGAGRQRVAIRGIDSKTGSTVVGYYLDETPIPDSSSASAEKVAFDPSLIDVDRVEVLRGPQGTVYGAGSMGGTIRVIPKAPNVREQQAHLNAKVLSTDGSGSPGYEADFMLNTPLIADRLGLRIVGWYSKNDGFIERRVATPASLAANRASGAPLVFERVDRVPESKTYGGRVALRFQATDAAAIEVSAFSQDQDFGGFQDITTGPLNPQDDLVQNFLFDYQERNRNRLSIANVKGLFDVGFADIVASVSYSKRTLSMDQEAAAALESVGIAPIYGAVPIHEDASDKSRTAEVRMSSKAGGAWQWLAGVFYADQDGETNIPWRPAGFSANVFPVADDNLFTAHFFNTVRQKAVFGELGYQLTQKLKISAGARVFKIVRRDYNAQNGLFTGVDTADQPNPYADPPAIGSASSAVYKFDANWQQNENLLLYAHIAEGFRGGYGRSPLPVTCDGDLAPLGETSGPGVVKPDKLWNYEIGMKSNSADNRVRVNASGYLIDWKDIQNSIFLPCGFPLNKNLGGVRNYGGEVEVEVAVNEGLTVGASAGYIHSALREDIYGIPNTKGKPLPDVPKITSGAYASYEFGLGGSWSGIARTDFSYTDGSLSAYALGGANVADKGSLNLWDARLTLQHDRLKLALYVKNILNDVERTALERDVSLNVADRLRYSVNAPRTIGVSVGYEF